MLFCSVLACISNSQSNGHTMYRTIKVANPTLERDLLKEQIRGELIIQIKNGVFFRRFCDTISVWKTTTSGWEHLDTSELYSKSIDELKRLNDSVWGDLNYEPKRD